ncbi:hypothetical protein NN561_020278 [Cricetulus griseus]
MVPQPLHKGFGTFSIVQLISQFPAALARARSSSLPLSCRLRARKTRAPTADPAPRPCLLFSGPTPSAAHTAAAARSGSPRASDPFRAGPELRSLFTRYYRMPLVCGSWSRSKCQVKETS